MCLLTSAVSPCFFATVHYQLDPLNCSIAKALSPHKLSVDCLYFEFSDCAVM